MPTLIHFSRNDCLEIGCDEAGRGCLLGPVVAAAVMIDPEITLHKDLNDSKKVTPTKREFVKEWIEENCLHGIGCASQSEIDDINIRQATFLAMHRAIENIGIEPEHLLIDGDSFKPYKINDKIVPYTMVPKGDSKYASIAAASILAKQHRDAMIFDLVATHPELKDRYHIDQNMGYGSSYHMQSIRENGPSEFHRKSFSPCKEYLCSQSSYRV